MQGVPFMANRPFDESLFQQLRVAGDVDGIVERCFYPLAELIAPHRAPERDDLVQECVARAWRFMGNYKPDRTSAFNYFAQVMASRCIEAHCKQAQRAARVARLIDAAACRLRAMRGGRGMRRTRPE